MGGLWRNNEESREGKYLVERGGVLLDHPYIVLGARDPAAPAGLRAYAAQVYEARYVGSVEDGSYVVTRRNGTRPEWPFAVFHAADPLVPTAIRAYARSCMDHRLDGRYVADLYQIAVEFDMYREQESYLLRSAPDADRERVALDFRGQSVVMPHDLANYTRLVLALADVFEDYRSANGTGDPDSPRASRDDPDTIAKMRGLRGA